MSDDELVGRLLLATRLGDVEKLEGCFSTMPDPALYINRVFDDNYGQQKFTLLTLACLRQRKHVVHLFLRYPRVDLEIRSDVLITLNPSTRKLFRRVSALWTAAAVDAFDIVQLLVEHGANVNGATAKNSTALRAACYNGSLDMARYLIEHGADVRIAKEKNSTNLMISASRGHLDMVTYLVDELACDVNVCDDDGRSALYNAVINGWLKVVKFLLGRGAQNTRAKVDQMSPLMWAAVKGWSELVEAIEAYCSLLEQIEGEELLGSALIIEAEPTDDLGQAALCFRRALELRATHHLPKATRSTTDDVFGDRQECQTVDELQKLGLDLDSMSIEALLVQERLLGAANADYRRSLRFRGAILADSGLYDEGLAYWMYELRLRRQFSIPLAGEYFREFALLFSYIFAETKTLPVEAFLQVMEETTRALDQAKGAEFDQNLCALLFLITIVSRLLASNPTPSQPLTALLRHIRSVTQRQYTTVGCGSSLLHLAVDANTQTSDDDDLAQRCKYPCLPTAQLLLRSGAPVNAPDAKGNTPLHVFVENAAVADPSILDLLCNAGAHLDYANALGERPIDLAGDPALKNGLQNRTKLTLKCMCARRIRRENVPLHGKVAKSLQDFVERH